jgi:hypothetical protein
MKEFFDSVWRFLFGTDPQSLFGSGNWSFSFIADYSNYMKLSLGLVFAFMVWLTIRSYRREGETSRGRKALLASLRILVLVLLFVIVMKPAVIWRRTRTLYSDVVILCDDSGSMTQTSDVYDRDQTEQIAKFLGLEESQVEELTRMDILLRSQEKEGPILEHLARNHTLKVLAFSTDEPQLESYVRELGSLRLVGDGATGGADGSGLAPAGVIRLEGNRYDLGPSIRRLQASVKDLEAQDDAEDSSQTREAERQVPRVIAQVLSACGKARSDLADSVETVVEEFKNGRIDRLALTRRVVEILESGPDKLVVPTLSQEQREAFAQQEKQRLAEMSQQDSPDVESLRERVDQLASGKLSYRDYLLALEEVQSRISPDVQDRRTVAQQIRSMLYKLDGKGFQTRYDQAVRRVLEMIRGQRTQAIVVIGDGQNTSDPRSGSIEEIQAEAKRLGVPIFTFMLGSPRRPASVHVSSLHASDRVPRNSSMKFTATVSYCNIERDEQLHLRLLRRPADKPESQWTQVGKTLEPVFLRRPAVDEYNETLSVTDIEIPYEPKDVGHFEFKAEPERDLSDNRARKAQPPSVLVRILDERIRILLVSGDAGWEFQHLKNFLQRQPDLYQLSVWQQNADPEINQASSTGMKLDRLPRTLEELVGSPGWTPEKAAASSGPKLYPGYNVVILYDPYPTENGFDGEFVKMLDEYVDIHGGGLCYIASNKNSQKLLVREDFAPLRNMLPVSLSFDASTDVRRISGDRSKPWKMKLTPYGQDHPIMMIEDSPEFSRNAWAMLPGVYTYHHVRERKPLARVLAVHGNPNKRSEDDLPEPLVAYLRYNLGRVLYMGTDETWRWVFVDGGYYYRRYWSNAVRFLATLRPKLVDILLVEGKERYDLDETVTIEVRAYNDNYQPLTDETFPVILIPKDPDRKEIRIELEATDRANYPGKYRGTFEPEIEGSYTVTALEEEQREDRVSEKRLIITVPEAEKKQPQANAKLLHRLASEGCALNITDMDKLRSLPTGQLEVPDDVRKELWDIPLMLLAIVLLLCIEWILRKKYNMA